MENKLRALSCSSMDLVRREKPLIEGIASMPLVLVTFHPNQTAPMSKKILIVDDDRFYTRYLSFLLPKFYSEHTILQAENGNQAWEHISDLEWKTGEDLIILDLQMPELNGFTLLSRMRKAQKRMKNFPKILVNSSYPYDSDAPMFKSLELDLTLFQKPLNLSDVRKHFPVHLRAS